MFPFRFLAGVGAALLCVASPAFAAPETAKRSHDFADSIGVNIHVHYTDTVYFSRWNDLILPKLQSLGVSHVRDGAVDTTLPEYYARFNQLGQNGIGTTFIFAPNFPLSKLATFTNQVGNLEAFEGPNEYDTAGDANWVNVLRAYQQNLYGTVKGNPALASKPVIGPSLVYNPQSWDALGSLSSWMDFGATHSYPLGEFPSSNLDGTIFPREAKLSGSKPLWSTETGYNNALNAPANEGHKPVSEAIAAVYMPRLYLEHFNRGIRRSFGYELIDLFPDSPRTEREHNFGLLRNDGSEKPAFVALKNLIALTKNPGSSFTPGTLDYSLGGQTANVHRTLLQKSDGTFLLALWLEKSSWNTTIRAPITIPSQNVTVNFVTPIFRATRFVPNDGMAGTPLTLTNNALSVAVGEKVVLLELQTQAPVTTGLRALRCAANGKFVCADNAGTSPLIANRNSVGDWEKFDVQLMWANTYSIKALANNKFVCADNAGTSPLVANRTGVGDWEKFDIIPVGNNLFALKSYANGKYVSARGGTLPLLANATAIGDWEKFGFLDPYAPVSTQSASGGAS